MLGSSLESSVFPLFVDAMDLVLLLLTTSALAARFSLTSFSSVSTFSASFLEAFKEWRFDSRGDSLHNGLSSALASLSFSETSQL